MNGPLDPHEPLASIEERLQALAPAALPPSLRTRLAGPVPARRKVINLPWLWLSLPAAACLALAVWFAREHRTAEPDPVLAQGVITPESLHVYTPISSRNLLLDAREIGVVTPANSPPIRLVRCLWLDDATYRTTDVDADDLQVTHTHEQIIPIALTIY